MKEPDALDWLREFELARRQFYQQQALDRLRKFEQEQQRHWEYEAGLAKTRGARGGDAWIVRTLALSCTLSLVSVVITALLLIFR